MFFPSLFGVTDSGKSGHLTPADAHVLIASQTVGAGGAASVTFSSIPQGYRALELRIMARSTYAATSGVSVSVAFNGIGGTSYSYHFLSGDGAGASSGSGTSQPAIPIGYVSGASATTGIFGVAIAQILDYASTSKYKTVRSLMGSDTNGAGGAGMFSGLYMDTTAISSLVLTSGGSASFAQYGRFDLYGIL